MPDLPGFARRCDIITQRQKIEIKTARAPARIAGAGVRIREEIIRRVVDQVDQIRENLKQAADWASCSPRKQAARFAAAVRGCPAPHLCFAALKGNPNDKAVRRSAKTPRDLVALAEQMGVRTDLRPDSSEEARIPEE